MVHLSRKKEDMASNGLEHSMLNDSLEIGEWRATASVAPETRNGGTDYSAFSENGALYLGLFPHYVVNMLQDKSSWKNRASGIGEIQSTISSVQDSSTLEANLPMIVNLVTVPLGDANFKVAQTGLELVGCLVLKVGRGLTPYLPVLVPRILAKMGSNKYAIRQAGMKVLMQLMRCCKAPPLKTHCCKDSSATAIVYTQWPTPIKVFLPFLVSVTLPITHPSPQQEGRTQRPPGCCLPITLSLLFQVKGATILSSQA